MIIPHTGPEWKHGSLALPGDPNVMPRVDLVFFPGKETLDDVNLLDYPWLCHELGHNLLFRHDDAFVECVREDLSTVLGEQRSRLLGLPEAVKESVKVSVERMESAWGPSSDHRNWSHEIASDIVALWSCGPAFLAAYEDQVDRQKPNPYVTDQIHPPYEVRTLALAEAAKRLGWKAHVPTLEERVSRWRESWSDSRNNEYAALFDETLIQSVVSCALTSCSEFRLPRCDDAQIEGIHRALESGTAPQIGLDLLLTAWVVYNRHGPDDYHAWERDTLDRLSQ